MTYRGTVMNGVIVLEGNKLAEGTLVDVTPTSSSVPQPPSAADHPAIGIWRDRTDLPADSVEASKTLRQRLMRHQNE